MEAPSEENACLPLPPRVIIPLKSLSHRRWRSIDKRENVFRISDPIFNLESAAADAARLTRARAVIAAI